MLKLRSVSKRVKMAIIGGSTAAVIAVGAAFFMQTETGRSFYQRMFQPAKAAATQLFPKATVLKEGREVEVPVKPPNRPPPTP